MSVDRRVVALGGGHGLSVTLQAPRQLNLEPTAVVGTGDDGGSSGRLRADLGVLPPGDLRMAIAALADEGLWRRVLQHRFGGTSDVHGHALGNLLLVALWDETGDIVAGLDRLAAILGARGRVLPNCLEPVDVIADVVDVSGTEREVIGQAEITTVTGRITGLRLAPAQPLICPEAVRAVDRATHVVLGPGSWFTSVLAHLCVPQIAEALSASSARRILVLNAGAQSGETEGFTAERHLQAWAELFPEVHCDVVLADPASVDDQLALRTAARRLGADVHIAPILAGPGIHDPSLLADALDRDIGGYPG